MKDSTILELVFLRAKSQVDSPELKRLLDFMARDIRKVKNMTDGEVSQELERRRT